MLWRMEQGGDHSRVSVFIIDLAIYAEIIVKPCYSTFHRLLTCLIYGNNQRAVHCDSCYRYLLLIIIRGDHAAFMVLGSILTLPRCLHHITSHHRPTFNLFYFFLFYAVNESYIYYNSN